MPGVGKSYYGKKAAEILKIKFCDTDKMIEKSCKLSINEIFEKHGEQYFREKEKEILKKTVEQTNEDLIIATGGGTASNNSLMDFMNENGITVWLNSEPEYLISNLEKQKSTRPLFKSEAISKSKLEKLYLQRADFYSQSKLKVMINEGLAPILFTNSLLLSTFE